MFVQISVKMVSVYGGAPEWATEEEFEGECTDSDGGQDYSTKGIINNVIEDYCNDDSWLIEYFCGDNNGVSSIPYSCPNGCENGVCISS